MLLHTDSSGQIKLDVMLPERRIRTEGDNSQHIHQNILNNVAKQFHLKKPEQTCTTRVQNEETT